MEDFKVDVNNIPNFWTTCQVCKKSFNSESKAPINIICCGNIACLACVESVMNKSTEPGTSIKGQFQCAFCESQHCAPAGFDFPLKF